MNQEVVTFLRVFNLFDRRNIVNVFGDTGQPDFTTQYIGRQQNPESPNTMEEYTRFPWHYSVPRQIQFGLEWSF
jgi:hypothetical protein